MSKYIFADYEPGHTLRREIKDMESSYDEQLRAVFEALHRPLADEEQPERKIGFLKEDALWECGHDKAGGAGLLIF